MQRYTSRIKKQNSTVDGKVRDGKGKGNNRCLGVIGR